MWHVPFHGLFAPVPQFSVFPPHMPPPAKTPGHLGSPKEAKMNLTCLSGTCPRGCPWIGALSGFWGVHGLFLLRFRQPRALPRWSHLRRSVLGHRLVHGNQSILYNILQGYPRSREKIPRERHLLVHACIYRCLVLLGGER